MALSFTDENGQTRFQCPSTVKEEFGHPGSGEASVTAFHYPSLAAVYGNRLVTGRRCEELDEAYALKTVVMHGCGLLSETSLQELPDGAEVLDAFGNRRLFTFEMELMAVLEHHLYLRDQVYQQVEAILDTRGGGRARIRSLSVSVPNYIRNSERKKNFDRLEADYLWILCPIWAAAQVDSIRVFPEGQALVSYLSAAPDDPLVAWRRKEMGQCFRDLRDDGCGRYFVVIDSGSSSVVRKPKSLGS